MTQSRQKSGNKSFRIWFKNSTRLTSCGWPLEGGCCKFVYGDVARKPLPRRDCRRGPGRPRRQLPALLHHRPAALRPPQAPAAFDWQAKPALAQTAHMPSLPAAATQTTAPSGQRLKLTFDTFVVGPSNELAYNAAKAVVCDKQSPFNPLFIHGGYGLGKTHLLQGICNEMRKTRPAANWLYLSAEDFANQFVLALKTRKLEAFRGRMRQTDLLAIDDIHFLASKPSTQEEFLHTFNTLDLAGRQVVLASDAHPKMIGQLSEKLVNRFVSGMVVKIDTPDFKTRCEICRRYARSINKHVPEEVISYIADNLKSNIRELQGAIVEISRFRVASERQNRPGDGRRRSWRNISNAATRWSIYPISSRRSASFFGITPSAIHSSKKTEPSLLPRHFSMYLARKHTRMSSFGDRPAVGRQKPRYGACGLQKGRRANRTKRPA